MALISLYEAGIYGKIFDDVPVNADSERFQEGDREQVTGYSREGHRPRAIGHRSPKTKIKQPRLRRFSTAEGGGATRASPSQPGAAAVLIFFMRHTPWDCLEVQRVPSTLSGVRDKAQRQSTRQSTI